MTGTVWSASASVPPTTSQPADSAAAEPEAEPDAEPDAEDEPDEEDEPPSPTSVTEPPSSSLQPASTTAPRRMERKNVRFFMFAEPNRGLQVAHRASLRLQDIAVGRLRDGDQRPDPLGDGAAAQLGDPVLGDDL